MSVSCATLTLAALLVQSPAMMIQAAPAPAAQPANGTPGYRVGPGDVLELTVAQRPELGRLATVQPTGTIQLPAAGELAVSGLGVDEIAARVAERLAGGGTTPTVAVRVLEHQSQFVWLRGAVAQPGRKPLGAGTRLIDALLAAGGLAAAASGELLLERPSGFADGSRELRLVLRSHPGARELEQLALLLAPDDVVTAAVQRFVRLRGAVRRPGRYPVDGRATLGSVVLEAGGPLRGGERARLRRGAATGPAREITADLPAILRGQEDDLPLLGDDEIFVERRR